MKQNQHLTSCALGSNVTNFLATIAVVVNIVGLVSANSFLSSSIFMIKRIDCQKLSTIFLDHSDLPAQGTMHVELQRSRASEESESIIDGYTRIVRRLYIFVLNWRQLRVVITNHLSSNPWGSEANNVLHIQWFRVNFWNFWTRGRISFRQELLNQSVQLLRQPTAGSMSDVEGVRVHDKADALEK